MSSIVHILNGPNINMTGLREKAHYGSQNYTEMCESLLHHAESLNLQAQIRQTNIEGELVSWIHDIAMAEEALILNAGAYTHTSIAIHDALKLMRAPVIEVHMSNVHAREEFRHRSYVSLAAKGVIAGFGADSYKLALNWVASQPIKQQSVMV
ncbi:MAG: type II 3-dehydroquinate dehydratase [Granulosicoccaceae bacterium]